MPNRKKKRYVHVGLGFRSYMFLEPTTNSFKKDCELVGLCDSNPGRLALANKAIQKRWKHPSVPTFSDRQFKQMIKKQKPDVVIVTSKDNTHDKYIVTALEMGCDVITEKPMTINEKKCQRIINAVKKTGRRVRVAFNYRYSPPRAQVKDLLMKGTIGKVLSVDFQWLLNTSHGADYFRRWHREKKNSGGLMVHKSTHHFDLVNWWLGAEPVEVYAMGARQFYGNKSGVAKLYGLSGHAERCLVCKHKKKCKFMLNLKRYPYLRQQYLECEKHDKYYRDRCVFGSPMDIEDNMNVVVRYNTGAFMSYSLNAFLPWEGYRIAFNGTKGRLEHDCVESVYISGDNRVQGSTIPSGTKIRVYPHFKNARNIPVKMGKGGHGGGDVLIKRDLFSPKPPKDKYKRAADHIGGARSILTGIAANKSMRTGKPVLIKTLVKGI